MLHVPSARTAALLGVVVAVVVLTGCSTSTAGEPTTAPALAAPTSSAAPTASDGKALPVRTRTFDVTTLNPCTLLTTDQLDALSIDRKPVGPKADTPVPGSTQCAWTRFSPIVAYGVSTDTARNAASIAASAEITTIETVGGVGAVVVDGQGAGCSYVLDTSDTTNIQVGATSRGSTAAVDCPKAKALAEAVVATLTALQPG